MVLLSHIALDSLLFIHFITLSRNPIQIKKHRKIKWSY